MKFTVLWKPSKEQNLAAIWMGAQDRNAVTSAAHTIDKLLSRNPESIGEVCFDMVRTLVIPPLGVDFEVMEDDRIVYELSVWDATQIESGE
ncbi:MAG: hypothetical protein JO112_11220 [Planctomycetes bacterium]|nr:hypothetical protein [Planctomycetota bacterium]